MKKIAMIFAVAVICSCEKVVLEDGGGEYGKSEVGGNVTLNVSAEPKPTMKTRADGGEETRADGKETRAGSVLSEVCGRLNVAVFDCDGKKVKTVAQQVSDAGFGTVGLSLADGSYTVVAIGHNSTGNATITSPEKVTFPNNKVTDTFCFCGQINISGDSNDYDIMMSRSVAMVRLRLDGRLATNDAAQLKFYYLGGSSTLSPETGYGCVNSKQTEYRMVSSDGVYEVYTLPHTHDDVISKLTVTALDAGDNAVGECIIENIPVTVNKITDCTGDMSSGGGGVSVGITVDTEWSGVVKFSY
jgi:hypothetical protein